MSSVCTAWIGFAGSVIGAFLAGVVAFTVMWRTNRANKIIQDRNQKNTFCAETIKLISEYCVVVTESFYSHREVYNSLEILRMEDLANKNYHEERLDQSRSNFETQYNKASILFYELDIKLRSTEGTTSILNKLREVHRTCKDIYIDKNKFETMTEELREYATIFTRLHTQ